MTAKDIMIPRPGSGCPPATEHVDTQTHLIDVLPKVLQAKDYCVDVYDGTSPVGLIDAPAMLRGFASLTAPRDDCSVITVLGGWRRDRGLRPSAGFTDAS